MKKTVRNILFLCLAVMPLNTMAQYMPTWASVIGVKTLRIGSKYTQEQVKAALGATPTKYESSMDEILGLGENYYYGENIFSFSYDGIFVGFYISTNEYPIFEQRGGIKIGDNINKTSTAIGYKLDAVLHKEQGGKYEWQMGDEVVHFETDGNNIITGIWHETSI